MNASYGSARAAASALLAAAGGGTLRLDGTADADLSLPGLRKGNLGAVPAELRLVADRLDIAFLHAVAPESVRVSEGKLAADLIAKGPLAAARPAGVIGLHGGKL